MLVKEKITPGISHKFKDTRVPIIFLYTQMIIKCSNKNYVSDK